MTIHFLNKQLSFPPKNIGKFNVKKSDNLKYLKTLKSNFFRLVVTSPPYNLNKEYEKKENLKDYVKRQEIVIKECLRVLHRNGSICWQVGNYINKGEVIPLDIPIYNIFKKNGLKLRNRIIWHFEFGFNANERFSGRYETILWFTKNDKYVFNLDSVRVPQKWPNKKFYKGPKKGEISSNPKGKNPSNIWAGEFLSKWNNPNSFQLWDIPNIKSQHPEKTSHPCQFPVGLVEPLVLALTNKGENVLDPYLGVGSSVIAAIKNGRNGYGCDNKKKYIDCAKERIALFKKGELKIRENNLGKHPGPKK